MSMSWLDHVNIRTSNLARMSRFYEEVLEMPQGWRPPFRFGGAWHYAGERAAVHLVEIAHEPPAGEPRLEHFAFRSEGLAGFLDRLRRHDVSYTISDVPELGSHQVNVFDPDGNHIEIQFLAEEEADLPPCPAGTKSAPGGPHG